MPTTAPLSSPSDAFGPFAAVLSKHGFTARKPYDQEKCQFLANGERKIISAVLSHSYRLEDSVSVYLRKYESPFIEGDYVSIVTVWKSDEDMDRPLTPGILDGILQRLADFEAGIF